MLNIPIITIDGPSGSGKGTISTQLAAKLGWHFLDSGLLYRVLAWGITQVIGLDAKLEAEQISSFSVLAKNLPVRFQDNQVFYNNVAISAAVRTEQISKMASLISAHPEIRANLLQRQRDFKQLPGLVADGRDMGTVVFPEANLKLYLDASSEERANRRYLQLKKAGFDVNLNNILAEIKERDLRDTTRKVAPLKPAEDAVIINTDSKDIATVLSLAWDLVVKQQLGE